MDKLQAIRIIKGAFNTLKKGIQAESIEEKQSVLTMFDAFSDQIEQAFEVLALSQEPYICDTCKHKGDGWDTEPCDGCCGNHSGYEPCDRRKNHEEKPHSLLDAYFQMRKESE